MADGENSDGKELGPAKTAEGGGGSGLTMAEKAMARRCISILRMDRWEVVNSMLIAWIMNTIEPTLRTSISMVDEAQALWEDLKLQFSAGNGPRISELRADIANCRQNGDTSYDFSVLELLNRKHNFSFWDPVADVTMESTKDLELDKELVAEEQLEAEKQLEPEERFELRNELIAEKEYGKDVILTSLVLIYDHQMGMCLICTLFPLSSFVPMGFLDKVFNEANDSHSNHPFGDPNHGITFRILPHGIYMESSLFYAHYKPKKSPNQVVNLLVKKDDENRRSRVIFEAKGSEESFLFKFYL
ncbi:hypothetical protein ISN45_Aa07g032750 [Arabidopsis thaliana x Arabidopsis arenosa]|uniref:Uncharacterized protein n=1 Tax=Arabidopsis thaliana x Arabidopsis arenosa TaxID=1240361 RepID=A0A8T1Y8N2_9BRAS|nr:hypothetical protein ISN45_Aa07g032750 [Arabidopsis thaliana x Arabidopsis arenosa]